MDSTRVEEGLAQDRASSADAQDVACFPASVDRRLRVGGGGVIPRQSRGRLRRPHQQVGPLARLVGHQQTLLGVRNGLVVGTQRRGSLDGRTEGDLRLHSDRLRLVSLGRRLVGSQVMRCQRAGRLLVPDCLVMPRDGKVACPSIAPRERSVGHLPNQ